jgi:hypothetical protein
MITQEEFDNLKEGDVLESTRKETFTFETKLSPRVALFTTWSVNSGKDTSYLMTFSELKNEFSLVKKEPNYQGFPIGDYSDKTVIVKVWDKDPNNKQIGVISKVTEQGIYIEKLSVNWFNAEIITPTPITLIQ